MCPRTGGPKRLPLQVPIIDLLKPDLEGDHLKHIRCTLYDNTFQNRLYHECSKGVRVHSNRARGSTCCDSLHHGGVLRLKRKHPNPQRKLIHHRVCFMSLLCYYQQKLGHISLKSLSCTAIITQTTAFFLHDFDKILDMLSLVLS